MSECNMTRHASIKFLKLKVPGPDNLHQSMAGVFRISLLGTIQHSPDAARQPRKGFDWGSRSSSAPAQATRCAAWSSRYLVSSATFRRATCRSRWATASSWSLSADGQSRTARAPCRANRSIGSGSIMIEDQCWQCTSLALQHAMKPYVCEVILEPQSPGIVGSG